MKQQSSAEILANVFQDQVKLDELMNSNNPARVLADAAQEVARNTWTGDTILYRIAIGVLGALALIAAIGAIGLASFDKPLPEVVVALGSTAVGALVGLFAPSPTQK